MDSPTDQKMQDATLTRIHSDCMVQQLRLERHGVRSFREILDDPTMRERHSALEVRV